MSAAIEIWTPMEIHREAIEIYQDAHRQIIRAYSASFIHDEFGLAMLMSKWAVLTAKKEI
jgi:hypothetical protein